MPQQLDLDNLCNRCLRCCFRMAVIDGAVFRTPFPCEHLDIPGRRCRIYPDRHTINKNCLTIAEALRVNALPKDCPYASGAGKDYTGQQSLPSDWLTDDALRLLGRDLGADEDMIDAALRGEFDIVPKKNNSTRRQKR
ncbi:MAG: hypothetical protein ABIH86_04335 [Planctomycetota bacterium]